MSFDTFGAAPSSDVWCTDSLPICPWSFHPFDGVFHTVKILILMIPNVAIFPFVECIIGGSCKTPLPGPTSQKISLVFF